jgi:hypothetical protein
VATLIFTLRRYVATLIFTLRRYVATLIFTQRRSVYFPFFMPPPLKPAPFILELPGLGARNRFLFLVKSLTVFFFGARIFGFFGSSGFSFGVESLISSDMAW